MANKNKIIRSINEWISFQNKTRKVFEKFVSGKISDKKFNDYRLDNLYLFLSEEQLELNLDCFIQINTLHICSAVVDLIVVKNFDVIQEIKFSDCLIGELEVYDSNINKIQINNCTIGFLDCVSLQCKSFRLFDSSIDEVNLIRSKFKFLRLYKTMIELGNVDLCTFFTSVIKVCDIRQIHIGEALMPIISIDDQTSLETTICFLTYLKSKDINHHIQNYFDLGGMVCQETQNYLEIKNSSIWVFDDKSNGLMATFLNEFPQFLTKFNIDIASMDIHVGYPCAGKVSISISDDTNKQEFYKLFHAYTAFLLMSHGKSFHLEPVLQDQIKEQNLNELCLLKDLNDQFKMFDPRFRKLESLWHVKETILQSLQTNQALINCVEDLKTDVSKLKLTVSMQDQRMLRAAEYIAGLQGVDRRGVGLRKVN
ncbi:MAG: hypothetical protein KC646_10325 [Candidatus Cloacimonetes bacterium]|nr:hypothetical protein [Candidatus Cloacimonadota bacterium]